MAVSPLNRIQSDSSTDPLQPLATGVFHLSSSFVIREESFGGLLFSRDSWDIFELNHSAYRILGLLSQKTLDLSSLVSVMKLSYPGMSKRSEEGVSSFVLRMASVGVIERTPTNDSWLLNRETAQHQNILKDLLTPRVASGFPKLARFLSAPLFIWWDITGACNLKCKQCYSASGRSLPDELSTLQVCNLLDQLSSLKVFYVYFLGGEPLLRSDFFSILEHCRRLGLGVMISTNGWFINQPWASRLAQLGVRHVRVSLDGSTAKTHDSIRGISGSFDRAANAVRFLRTAGVPIVGVAPTLMRRNVREAAAIIDLASELGANEVFLGQICKVGRGAQLEVLTFRQIREVRELMLQKEREYGAQIWISGSEGIWENKPCRACVLNGTAFPAVMGCGAGRTCMAVGPNGRARACLLYRQYIGDLSAQSLDSLWRSAPSAELLRLREIKEGCDECTYAHICSGPCPMQRGTLPAERRCFVETDKRKEVH